MLARVKPSVPAKGENALDAFSSLSLSGDTTSPPLVSSSLASYPPLAPSSYAPRPSAPAAASKAATRSKPATPSHRTAPVPASCLKPAFRSRRPPTAIPAPPPVPRLKSALRSRPSLAPSLVPLPVQTAGKPIRVHIRSASCPSFAAGKSVSSTAPSRRSFSTGSPAVDKPSVVPRRSLAKPQASSSAPKKTVRFADPKTYETRTFAPYRMDYWFRKTQEGEEKRVGFEDPLVTDVVETKRYLKKRWYSHVPGMRGMKKHMLQLV